MRYSTIWSSPYKNQIILVKSTLEQNNISCRIVSDDTLRNHFPPGMLVQVPQEQRDRALRILRENDFLKEEDRVSAVLQARFWVYLLLALLFIILAAIVINRTMAPG